MGTVGEMVFAEPAPFRPEGEDDNAQTGAAMVVDRLKSLGIWDAEVLDSEVGLDTDGTLYVCPWGPDNRGWDCRGFEAGQRVRVIVLPKEEK